MAVNSSNYNLVNSAYQGIGRTGFGAAPNQIDQEGFNYWLGELDSGALPPDGFQTAFDNSVNTVLAQDPGSDVSKFVSSYRAGADLPGYGSGPYQSSLIQSLRGASPAAPMTPTVNLLENKSNFDAPDFSEFGSGRLNNPDVIGSYGAAATPGSKTTTPTTKQSTLINNPPKIETTVEDYLPFVVENVNDYLGSQSNEDLVRAAYERIGRTGPGTDTTGDPAQIDQEGWKYWTNELNQGNLTPAEFEQTFSNSVNTVLDQNPDAAVSQYVSDYLGGLTNDQLVREAYADIGRAGIGSTASTIDKEGYDYWTGLLDSGVSPEDFQKAFYDSVVTVLGYYPGQESQAVAPKTTQANEPTTGVITPP